jgi:hypothetical protein
VLDDELAASIDGIDPTPLRLQRIQLLNDQYRAAVALEDITDLVAEIDAGEHAEIELEARLANGRTHYILSLDDPEHALPARTAYEQAYAAAAERGDKRAMALALLPTTWFTDYWRDYGPTAAANIEEALRLAGELGDTDLQLDARAAAMRDLGVVRDAEAAERLRDDLEARHDPVRLNAHCFWMMWQYFAAGRFADCVATCARGIELAGLLGTSPVQYGSIKALALTEMGRFDEVEGALAEEVTDDDHPFGQAMAMFSRSAYLTRIGAWSQAADALVETIERATALSRVWMSAWAASMLAVVAAQLQAAGAEEAGSLADVAGQIGDWSRGATGAHVALIEGRVADCLALLAGHTGDPPDHDGVVALDVAARAHLAGDDPAQALEAADAGLAAATAMGFGALEWRLRAVRARALDALGRGDEASAEQERSRALVDTLVGRIDDPTLRDSFRRLVATLGAAGDRGRVTRP